MAQKKSSARYFESEAFRRFEDLPNVGKEVARDLRELGLRTPSDLLGKDPFTLYKKLCKQQKTFVDACMLDVLISITDFVGGAPAKPWWFYTLERKKKYPELKKLLKI